MRSSNILILGAGRMGGAIVHGMSKSPQAGFDITIVDPGPDVVERFSFISPDSIYRAAGDLPAGFMPDVVILAVKPKAVIKALAQLGSHLSKDALILSVAAGVSMRDLKIATDDKQPVVRCMPNLAAEIGQSPSVVIASTEVERRHTEILNQILVSIGSVHWIDDEDLMHSVTAISGSGPAYLFAFAEALTDASIELGLTREQGLNLSLDMINGAAALLKTHRNPAALREQVTSPGGTTQAALEILCGNGGLQSLIVKATARAAERSRALGGG